MAAQRSRSLTAQLLLVLGVAAALAGALLGSLVNDAAERRVAAESINNISIRLEDSLDTLADRHNRSVRRTRDALLEEPENRVALLTWGAEHYQAEMERLIQAASSRTDEISPAVPDPQFDPNRDGLRRSIREITDIVPNVAATLQQILDAAAIEDVESERLAQQELARLDRRMEQALTELRAAKQEVVARQSQMLLQRRDRTSSTLATLLVFWVVLGGGWLIILMRALVRLRRGVTQAPRSREEAEIGAELARMQQDLTTSQNNGAERSRDLEQQRTATRRAERELALLRIYNDNLLGSLSSAIVVTDIDLALTGVNQAARRLLGLAESDLGKSLLSTTLGSSLEQRTSDSATALKQAVSERRLLRLQALPFSGPRDILLDVVIAPYLDESGAARGLLFVADDVTDSVNTKNQLLAAEHLAAIGRVSAQVAHEIRNPLSAIGLNAELLSEELEALPQTRRDEAQGMVKAMAQEIERLTHITEGYLRLARMPHPAQKDSDLNQLVVDLLTMLREELKAHGVDVQLDLASPAPRAFIDPGQIRQALINVVKNSREAMPEGGTLRVRTEQNHEGAVLQVSDTGVGMPPEVMRRVFEPFFSTKPAGTGLGLSLTQQILAEHRGSIRLEARSGGGTTVTLALPPSQSLDADLDPPKAIEQN